MEDIEKVIKAVDNCIHYGCKKCTYYDNGCEKNAMLADVLELLKEQENKKLIDADKLREKLGFAEHCEDCKHDSWKCGRDTIYSIYDFCTAIDIAIEELMQEGR